MSIDAAIKATEGESVVARQFGPVKIASSGRMAMAQLGLPDGATEGEVAEFMAWLTMQAIGAYRQMREQSAIGRIHTPHGIKVVPPQ